MSTIGIFGGTFDPIHFGHLRSALELREKLNLGEIRLIPCATPPHRDKPGVSAEHRLAMLQLAVSETNGLIADDRELRRPQLSYTVDTLTDLKRDFPDARLLLFIGVDAFSGFQSWHRWDEILLRSDLVVITRPGAEMSQQASELLKTRQIDSLIKTRYKSGNILLQQVTQLDISSTAIRKIYKCKQDPAYLLPVAVRSYIAKHDLYR